jgi:MinD-like ATPase involved in chromosome partitioning or flagellar assembly
MLTCCWSSKGGAGTTVVAAALARLAAALEGPGALLVDLDGDAGAVLGLPDPESPGRAGGLRAGERAPVDALARLEQPVAPGLALLPRGAGTLPGDRAAVLAAVLAGDARRVVADCGTVATDAAHALAVAADRSILVTRPCFLALRRARAAAIRPSEVVLVTEPGRSITRHDIEAALGAPVIATVPFDPAIARAVDAGLLATRLPRALSRELGRAV